MKNRIFSVLLLVSLLASFLGSAMPATAQEPASGGGASDGGGGMLSSSTISGHAYDAQGQPLQEAVVTVFTQDMQYVSGNSSGANGAYSISGIPGGIYLVVATKGEYERRFYPDTNDTRNMATLNLTTPQFVSGIDFHLGPGGSISGRLTSGGQLVNGIRVVALYPEGQGAWLSLPSSDGNYVIDNLPLGSYKLMAPAQLPGSHNSQYNLQFYNDTTRRESGETITIGGNSIQVTSKDFSLVTANTTGAGGVISGQIYDDATGTPLSGAKVMLWTASTGEYVTQNDTNTYGNYAFSNLSDGSYKVLAVAPNHAQRFWSYALNYFDAIPIPVTSSAGMANVNIGLKPGKTLGGTIYDDSNESVSGIGVYLKNIDGPDNSSRDIILPTDSSGHFETNVPYGNYKIFAPAGVTPKDALYKVKYYINSTSLEYAEAVNIDANTSRTNIDLNLISTGGTISGHVYEMDGQTPIFGATISIRTNNSPSQKIAQVTTGKDGFYVASGLPAGSYAVFAVAQGHGQKIWNNKLYPPEATPVVVNETLGCPGINFNLEAGGPVHGTISSATTSPVVLNNISVKISPVGDSDPTHFWIAMTKDQGVYSLNLPYHEYTVIAPSGFAPGGQPFGSADNNFLQAPGSSVTVSNSDGAAADFSLTPVGGVICGYVRKADGVTGISGASIAVSDYKTHFFITSATTDTDGNYIVTGLNNGQYMVSAWAPNHVRKFNPNVLQPPNAQPIVVTDDQKTFTSNFTLEPGGTISGVVSSGQNHPLNVSVFAQGVNGNNGSGMTVITNPAVSGNYTINGLPFGDYIVRSPSGIGSGSADGIYIQQYFNHQLDAGTATKVTISQQNPDYSGVNFDLTQGATANVDFRTSLGFCVSGNNTFLNREVNGNKAWNAGFNGTNNQLNNLNLTLNSDLIFDWKAQDQLTQDGPPVYRWSYGTRGPGWGVRADVGLNNNPVTFTPGFDAYRDVDKTIFNDSGIQVLTVRVTPRETLSNIDINVNLQKDQNVDPTIFSPVNDPPNGTNLSGDGKNLGIHITNPITGHTYEYQVSIQVNLLSQGTTVEYMPYVNFNTYHQAASGSVTGSVATRTIDQLGTWTWKADGTNAWNWNEGTGMNISFQSYSYVPGVNADFHTIYGYSFDGDDFTDRPVDGNRSWATGFTGLNVPLDHIGLNLHSTLDISADKPAPSMSNPPDYQWSWNNAGFGFGQWVGAGTKSNPLPVTFYPGFNATRTLDKHHFTASGTQILTIQVTPTQAYTNFQISVYGGEDQHVNPTIVQGIFSPDGAPLNSIHYNPDGHGVDIHIDQPEVGHPYTYQIAISVALKSNVSSLDFQPWVDVSSFEKIPGSTQYGSSFSHAMDNENENLGTWTWNAGQDLTWNWNLGIGRHVYFSSQSFAQSLNVNFQTQYKFNAEGDSFTDDGSAVTGYQVWASGYGATNSQVNAVSLNFTAATASMTWEYPPAVVDPPNYHWSFGDIQPWNKQMVYLGNNSPIGFSPGFDVERSFDQTEFTTSGNQTMTITIKPKQASQGRRFNIGVKVKDDNLVIPAIISPIDNPNAGIWCDGKNLGMDVGYLTPGNTYTYTVKIQLILKDGVNNLEFKPDIWVFCDEITGSGVDSGSSKEGIVPDVGTWTWNAGNSITWSWNQDLMRLVEFAPYSGALENVSCISNGDFSNGLNGWIINPQLPDTWNPLSQGAVTLHPDNVEGFTGPIIYQNLNVGNVAGKSFHVSLELTSPYSAPPGKTVAVYCTYMDANNNPQTLKILNPDNSTISSATPFKADFTLPLNARKLVKFTISKENNGFFLVDNIELVSTGVTVGPVPFITAVTGSGAYGSTATINGSHFGSTPGVVKIGGSEVNINSWSDGEIVVGIDDPVRSGRVCVIADFVESNIDQSFDITSPNYTLDIVGNNFTVIKGQKAFIPVRIDFHRGFTTQSGINFSVISGLPGQTCQFTPMPLMHSGGTALVIDTSSLPAGIYPAQVQSTEIASAPRTAAFKLKVVTVSDIIFNDGQYPPNVITGISRGQGQINLSVQGIDSYGNPLSGNNLFTLESGDPSIVSVSTQINAGFTAYYIYAFRFGSTYIRATAPDGYHKDLPVNISISEGDPQITSIGVNPFTITNRFVGDVVFSAAANQAINELGIWGSLNSGAPGNTSYSDDLKSVNWTFSLDYSNTNPNNLPEPGTRIFYALTGNRAISMGVPFIITNDDSFSRVKGGVLPLDSSLPPYQLGQFTLEFYQGGVKQFSRMVYQMGQSVPALFDVAAIPPGTYKIKYIPMYGQPQWYPNAYDISGAADVQFTAGQATGDIFFFAKPLTVPARITVTPSHPSLEAGASQTFTAQGYDGENNPIGGLYFNWSCIDSNAGSIDYTGAFTAGTVPGTYTDVVQASYYNMGTQVVGKASVTISPGGTNQKTDTNTVTILTGSGSPSISDNPVKFTATVSFNGTGTPTGTVTFKDGTNVLNAVSLNASSQAEFVAPSLSPGEHYITAVYSGDPSFNGSTSDVLFQQVNQTPLGSSFVEDFNDNNPDGWYFWDNDKPWTVEAGRLKCSTSQNTYAIYNNLVFGDMVVSADIWTPANIQNSDAVGIYARAQEPPGESDLAYGWKNNAYAFYLQSGFGMYINKWANGIQNILAGTYDISLEPNTYYHFKASVIRNYLKFKVWKDGQSEPAWQLSVVDNNPFPVGKIGLHGGIRLGDPVYFDNITVSPATAPPDSDLVSYWPLDEGQGTVVHDIQRGEEGTAYYAAWMGGIKGNSLSFNGVDSYVSVPNLVNNWAQGTIEGWVNYNGDPALDVSGGYIYTATAGAPLSGQFDGTNLGASTMFGDGRADLKFGIFQNGWQLASSNIVPTAGQWYHVAGTWGPTGMKVYVNGQLEGTNPYTGPSYPTSYNTIGAASWPYTSINARLDEIKVYDRALSPDEIMAEYRSGSVNRPALTSFSDPGYTTECNSFAFAVNRVYLKGTSFAPGSYTVAYFDGSGTNIKQDNVSVNGTGILLSNYELKSNRGVVSGTWHVLVQPASGFTGFGSAAFATITTSPATYGLAASHEFNAASTAIPEFPTAFTALGVTGLCLAALWWMRRKWLKA